MEQGNFNWTSFIEKFPEYLPAFSSTPPWQLTSRAIEIVKEILSSLPADYKTQDGIAIHNSAILESNVTLKAPIIVGPDCFIAANCYLRGGVFLMGHNSIGPGCEIKSSYIFPHSNLAHFNFVGDSVIGSYVNFEAGSIIANHFNERKDKDISVMIKSLKIETKCEKFGALVGDGSKIGANAVLSPGTILEANSIVSRLELVDQLK
jgi:NDP-sugar pyrophosphorylase family protein